MRAWRWGLRVVVPGSWLLASCTLPATVHGPTHVAAASGTASVAPASAGPTVHPSAPVTSAMGHVYGLQGEPAAGVAVRAYLITDNGSGLITDAGSAIIAHNGAGLVANNSGNLAVGFHLEDTPAVLDAVTAADGSFHLSLPAGQQANVEAVQSNDVKALAQAATSTAALDLHLAYTGSISGRVSVPDDPTVTDLEGVDVYIPGVPYALKTDHSGAFTLTNVPVGSYTLVASKDGLGRARAAGVVVASKHDTQQTLALVLVKPVLASLAPADGAPGQTVTLTGQNLGASTGTPFSVLFGGAAATTLTRKDDQTIVATVPPGVANGQVTVTVGGLTTNGLAFRAIKSIALTPPVAYLLPGKPQTYGVYALDSDGKRIDNPNVSWSASQGFGKLDGSTFTATGAEQGSLTVSAGQLSDSLSVQAAAAKLALTTFAGSHTTGLVDGDGAHALFTTPLGLVFDTKGNLIVSDGNDNAVRRIAPDGVVTTVAGALNKGFDNGPGPQARFNQPNFLAIDRDGNVYVADFGNNAIRKITPDGQVSTFAGTGVKDYADGPAASAKFDNPKGLAFAPDGTLYVSDWGDNRIRKVATDGTVSTLAGDGTAGLADGAGTAAEFDQPGGLAVDGAGNLYVADTYNNCIRKVTPDGSVTTLVGRAASADPAASGTASGSMDGDATTATLNLPQDVVFGPDGALYESESGGQAIRRIALDGHVTTLVAGTGTADGFDGAGQFHMPNQLAFDTQGRLFVADRFGDRVRMLVLATP